MNAPWNESLPTALRVGGEEYAIRSDYRVALDIFLALSDPEIADGQEKAFSVLLILYEDLERIPPEHWQEALDRALWFLRGGDEERGKSGPQLVSWSQDFRYIASPISAIIGQDIRGMAYLHWWSFLSGYMAIGDCLFAQIVRIRDKKARGKKLDKADREFYRRNRDLIEIEKPLTQAEEEVLKEWM